ncbi:MAG: porin family protein [Myxococcota bacterium]|nr:porin family protein [Myxococcota bacterium]
MKVRALLLGFALVFVTGSQAIAQDEDEAVDTTLTGWYVGGSATGAVENFSGGVDSTSGVGGGITVGHRASEFLSFELEMSWLDRFKAKPQAPGQRKSKIAIRESSLNFRVHFPTEDSQWEPYITYGVGIMDIETGDDANTPLGRINHSDLMVKGGAGVSYQVDNALSLFAGGTYVLPLGNIKEFDHAAFSVGFLYKFIDEDE